MRGAARPAAGSGGTGRSEGCFQGGSWQASAPALAGPPARPGGPSGRKSRARFAALPGPASSFAGGRTLRAAPLFLFIILTPLISYLRHI